jgi:hypothetical protein
MCVLAISDRCQKTVPVPIRGYTKLSTFSAPITMDLTKKRKAAASEKEDATPVKNGHKWASSHRSVKKEEAKKIPDEIHDPADTPFRVECLAHSNKRKSKAIVDVFGPEYEDAHLDKKQAFYTTRL